MISANIPNSVRKAIYARDHYACALCDCSRFLQIHHLIPRGQGGSNSPHNLITLCSYCHSHVHGHPPYETDVTPKEMAHFMMEYLADYYAPRWNPWTKEGEP